MADRAFDRVVRGLSSNFSALRDDIRRLTDVAADLAESQTDETSSSISGVVDKARDRLSATADRFATQAGDRVRGAGAEIEARIERNPMTAVMVAIMGGLVIGALSRSRR